MAGPGASPRQALYTLTPTLSRRERGLSGECGGQMFIICEYHVFAKSERCFRLPTSERGRFFSAV